MSFPVLNLTKRHRGFTLLEVMVSMLIFSIGLIGLAGLQAAGIRNNQISFSRTIATQLVYDMADRIRNNPDINYSGVSASSSPNCVTGSCSASQMAAFDVYEWNTAINNVSQPSQSLRNGVGFIETTSTGYLISIGWDEDGTGDTPTACNPSPTPSTITCVSVEVAP